MTDLFTRREPIKGPDFRNNLEVRRRWKCPSCNKERLVPGTKTAIRCSCDGETVMKLVDEFTPQGAQRFSYQGSKVISEEDE